MTHTHALDITGLNAFAVSLSKIAADISLSVFKSPSLNLENKLEAGFDPVTKADKDCEAAMREAIAQHYPDHGIIGEEFGAHNADAEWVWVLDPIDGTRAFISGIPLWTTLIGLRYQGKPLIGVIAQPVLDEIYLGSPHGSVLMKSGVTQPLKVRPDLALAKACLATTDPFLFKAKEADAFAQMRNAARLVRYGCDAYAFAQVAAGQLHGAFETGLKCWDIDAIIPVIENAGGVLSDWHGQTIGNHGGQVLASCGPMVHNEILGYLSKVAA